MGGSLQTRLNNYFNKSCFTTPPVIGADGIGTAFGDSGTGIVDGPSEFNVDLSISKLFPLRWPHDGNSLEFRAEFFNALNHPQFTNPDSNFSSSTFGVITRVGPIGTQVPTFEGRCGPFQLNGIAGPYNKNPITARGNPDIFIAALLPLVDNRTLGRMIAVCG